MILNLKKAFTACCLLALTSTAAPASTLMLTAAAANVASQIPSAAAAAATSIGNQFEGMLNFFNAKKEEPTAVQKIISPLERQQFERLNKLLSLKGATTFAHVKNWAMQAVKYAIPILAAGQIARSTSTDNINNPWSFQENLYAMEDTSKTNLLMLLPLITVGAIEVLKNLPFLKTRLQTEKSLVALEYIAGNWKSLKTQVPSRYHSFFASLADQYSRLGGNLEMREEDAASVIAVIRLEINKYLSEQTSSNQHDAVTAALTMANAK